LNYTAAGCSYYAVVDNAQQQCPAHSAAVLCHAVMCCGAVGCDELARCMPLMPVLHLVGWCVHAAADAGHIGS
jgi:hypothetical protein